MVWERIVYLGAVRLNDLVIVTYVRTSLEGLGSASSVGLRTLIFNNRAVVVLRSGFPATSHDGSRFGGIPTTGGFYMRITSGPSQMSFISMVKSIGGFRVPEAGLQNSWIAIGRFFTWQYFAWQYWRSPGTV
jgi:hypothetical protein